MKMILLTVVTLFFSSAFAAITPHDPLPTRLLSCGGAIIDSLSDRFGGTLGADAQTGTAVSYNNGGASVSYDLVEAARNSRLGDHVLMCLVFIPKKCPPGDDRGRIYTVTNLRTLESWTLPDSQHSCGGA